jgi:hypothetical protein
MPTNAPKDIQYTFKAGTPAFKTVKASDFLTGGTAVDSNTISGGGSADILTGAISNDGFRHASAGTTVDTKGLNVGRITDLLTGAVDAIQTAAGTGTVLPDINGFAGIATDATSIDTQAIAENIANTANVYAALTAQLQNGAGATSNFAASTAAAGGLEGTIVTFVNGAAASSCLTISDSIQVFQAANDLAVNMAGINSGAAAWAGGNSLIVF